MDAKRGEGEHRDWSPGWWPPHEPLAARIVPNMHRDPPTVFERHAYDEAFWHQVVPTRRTFFDSLREAVCSSLGERWVVDPGDDRTYAVRRADIESHRITVERCTTPIEIHSVGPRKPFRIVSFSPYAPIIEVARASVQFPHKTRPGRATLAKFFRAGSDFNNPAVAFYRSGQGKERGVAVHLSPFSTDTRPLSPEEKAQLPTIDSHRRLILRTAWAVWVLADLITSKKSGGGRRGAS